MRNERHLVSRSPRGSATGRNVSLRLREEERAALDLLALKEERSTANMARTLVLEALKNRGITIEKPSEASPSIDK